MAPRVRRPQGHRRKGDAGRCPSAVRWPPGPRSEAKTAGLALVAMGLPHHSVAVGVVNRGKEKGAGCCFARPPRILRPRSPKGACSLVAPLPRTALQPLSPCEWRELREES